LLSGVQSSKGILGKVGENGTLKFNDVEEEC